MKKTLLLLLLILFTTQSASAQFVRYGAKAGIGFTRMYGDDASSDVINSLPGFHLGLIGSYEFVSKLEVQAELLYEQKGFTYDGFPINSSEVLIDDQRLHYITLPAMLKAQKGGLFVEAGPYVGYLFSETTKVNIIDRENIDEANPVILGEYEISINDLKRWDYGYKIGFGIQLENGLFMSLHNTGGLTSHSKLLEQKNLAFTLCVGYLVSPRLP